MEKKEKRPEGAVRFGQPLRSVTSRRNLVARRSSSDGRSSDAHSDLLRLGFLALRNVQGQHAILVVGLDGFRVHGVGQGEAAAEGPVGTLHAQILVSGRPALELALAANGQDVVFHANVEILGIDIGEISLDDEFVLAFVNIDSWRPRGKAGIVSRALKDVVEQTTELLVKSRDATKGFKVRMVRCTSSKLYLHAS